MGLRIIRSKATPLTIRNSQIDDALRSEVQKWSEYREGDREQTVDLFMQRILKLREDYHNNQLVSKSTDTICTDIRTLNHATVHDESAFDLNRVLELI